MSYTAVRDDLLTQLRAVTNFETATVTIADYTVLNDGPSRAMVVHYLGVEVERQTFTSQYRYWRFAVDLLEKVDPDEASVEIKAAVDRENILNRLMQYPLGGGSNIQDAVVVNGEDQGDEVSLGGPKYFRETFVVRITESVAAGYQE